VPGQFESAIEQLAAEVGSDLGVILQFSKDERGGWAWMLGDNKPPANAEFVVAVEGLVTGWKRWEGGKVVERILKRPGDKRRLPGRDELSFANESDWPLDNKGQRKDPWQPQYYLPMLDTQGALVTFSSHTNGGKIAIGKLCAAYLKNKVRPIVTLDTSSFRSKKYGVIPAPAFTIIGFEGFAGVTEEPKASQQKEKEDSDFSDRIPF
jgi:hypothetical protein